MLFERINASGIGLVIGSIGTGDRVNNITFRDSYMYHTWKVRSRKIQLLNNQRSFSVFTYDVMHREST